jgi:hypothetical protein
MTYSLDEAGYDVTYVRRDGELCGMVQPDTYSPGSGRWTSWTLTGNRFDANGGWHFHRYHDSRREALAAVGYTDRSSR